MRGSSGSCNPIDGRQYARGLLRVWGPGHRGVPPMLLMDLVGIFRSGDHDRLAVVAEELRRRGVLCILLPSDQRIGTWDVEVPADAATAARMIVESVRVR
jgi:hypothetical protein